MSGDLNRTAQPFLGSCPGRRCVLGAVAAAGAAMLGGCAVYGDQQASPPTEAAPEPAATSSEPAGTPSGLEGSGPPLARLDDVPVGGGLVLAADRLVLTRPTEQTVKAFSAVCTHAGCVVSDVTDGTVNCACHGSKFAIEDGAPTAGPARTPLPSVAVTITGGAVVRA